VANTLGNTLETPEALLESLIREAEHFVGGVPCDRLKTATAEFLRQAQDAPVLQGLAASRLETLPPGAAAWLAVVLGTLVERGAPASDSGEEVLRLFSAYVEQLPSRVANEEALPPPTTQQARVLAVFSVLCQSVVAHLGQLDAHRAKLGRNRALIDRLEELGEYGPGAAWVRAALLKSSDSLVIVHVQSGRVYELKYVNISNCFHLFSLIQAAIGRRLPGGRTPNPAVTAAARGLSNAKVNDEAWWHYGSPVNSTPHIAASIWGEASVLTIPTINGKQVIVLWPSLLKSRSWDSTFYDPHLDALPVDLRIVRKLSRRECAEWLSRLKIKTSRPWWKLW